jgi:hypothetical protein
MPEMLSCRRALVWPLGSGCRGQASHTPVEPPRGSPPRGSHNNVYDTADENQVGTDLGFCIRISPADGSWTCEWTTFLAKGQINVAGPYYDTKNSVLAIIGGTGVYRTRAVR